MEENEIKEPVGCLGFAVGGLSFIPLIGVVFGIVAIVWGFRIKNLQLKIAGAAGISFTFILYGSLAYFGFVQKGGVYDDLRAQLTKTQLTSAVQAIEFYKVQNGNYPASLEILQKSLPEGSMVFLNDSAQVNIDGGGLYYYKLISDSTYHIRSYGRDGILDTGDDIFPAEIKNIGLIVDYSESDL